MLINELVEKKVENNIKEKLSKFDMYQNHIMTAAFTRKIAIW